MRLTRQGSRHRFSGEGEAQNGNSGYYVEGETLVAVPLTTEPEFTVGKAVRLFEHTGITRVGGQQYDVSADGQRFVVTDSVEEEEATSAVRIVQNWFAEFKETQE